jgi:TonB family protein
LKTIKILLAGVAVLTVFSASARAEAWMDNFYHEMDCNKFYPAEAWAQGESGVVKVGFRLDAAGRLVRIEVIGSSGSSLLDANAIDLVRRSLPSDPPSWGPHKYEMDVRYARGPGKQRPDNCIDHSTGVPLS